MLPALGADLRRRAAEPLRADVPAVVSLPADPRLMGRVGLRFGGQSGIEQPCRALRMLRMEPDGEIIDR